MKGNQLPLYSIYLSDWGCTRERFKFQAVIKFFQRYDELGFFVILLIPTVWDGKTDLSQSLLYTYSLVLLSMANNFKIEYFRTINYNINTSTLNLHYF